MTGQNTAMKTQDILSRSSRMMLKQFSRKALQSYQYCNGDISFEDYTLGILFLGATLLLHRIQSGAVKRDSIQLDMLLDEQRLLRAHCPRAYAAWLNCTKSLSSDTRAWLTETLSGHISAEKNIPDDMLSWCYQYLKIDKEKAVFHAALSSGEKIDNDSILPATQFFTEKYMVEHLVTTTIKHANVQSSNAQNLLILDPACGGGNFLVVALESLFHLFIKHKGISPVAAMDLLLQHNIWGVEIDVNLAEIARLNLLLKAYSLVPGYRLQGALNIITCSPGDYLGMLARDWEQPYLAHKTLEYRPNLKQKLASTKVLPIILTNPPFMGRRLMGEYMKIYLSKYYPDSASDLCFSFMERCLELINERGIVGLVNQTSWMFLKTTKRLRQKVLKRYGIAEIVTLGSKAFLDLNGEKSSVALTIFTGRKKPQSIRFVNLAGIQLDEKANLLLHGNIPGNKIVNITQENLEQQASDSIAHLRTGPLCKGFNRFAKYSEFAKPMQGTSTGDNKKFICYAWERPNDQNWRLVSKGGGFCRWTGLNNYKVLWGRDAEFIRQHPGSALRNIDEAVRAELVYSDTGTMGLNVRLKKNDQIFIASGPGIKVNFGDKMAHLAFLNSRVASFFMRALSPKLTISAGYIGMLPVPKGILDSALLARLAAACITLKNFVLEGKLGNAEFRQTQIHFSSGIDDYIDQLIMKDLRSDMHRLEFEYKINNYITMKYGFSASEILSLENEIGVDSMGFPRSKLQATPEDVDKLISQSLSATCEYTGRRASASFLGCDGAIEELSYRLHSNPRDVLKFTISNVKRLPRLRQMYLDDLLHKRMLKTLGFQNNDVRSKCVASSKEISKNICKELSMSPSTVNQWIEDKFNTVHADAFRGHGFVQSKSGTSGLKFLMS